MPVTKTRWAEAVDGAYIAYQEIGGGPATLVVIHGWVSHLEVYWEQPRFARFIRRLSRSFRVLHFDKRGTGMSDRISSAPDLETQMDDVRAVMDAAGVERGAVMGWGTGGPPLALFFAASHPDRTVAVCTDSWILDRSFTEYPWGLDDTEHERLLASFRDTWGDEDRLDDFVKLAFGDDPRDAPVGDIAFRRWCAKWARFSATPGSYQAFDRMWYQTDVRDILSSVRVPALVLYKTGATNWGTEAQARYLAGLIPAAQLTGVSGSAPVVWIEEPDPLVSAIEAFLLSVHNQEEDLGRVLATVLFTDIVGSTETAYQMGDRAWKDLVERHHSTIRTLLTRYRGQEVDTAGDGFFASFDGPARAVRCAQAITAAVGSLGLQVRAGLHTGEVETVDGKLGGIAVNIGARIGAHAQPSEILISQTVKDLVAGSGLEFHDRGTYQLKGVPGDWRLYAPAS